MSYDEASHLGCPFVQAKPGGEPCVDSVQSATSSVHRTERPTSSARTASTRSRSERSARAADSGRHSSSSLVSSSSHGSCPRSPTPPAPRSEPRAASDATRTTHLGDATSNGSPHLRHADTSREPTHPKNEPERPPMDIEGRRLVFDHRFVIDTRRCSPLPSMRTLTERIKAR